MKNGIFTCITLLILIQSLFAADYYNCKDDEGINIFTDDIDECANEIDINFTKPATKPIPAKVREPEQAPVDESFHILSTYRAIKTIDGVLGRNEWRDVEPYVKKVTLPLGGTEDVYLYVMHDLKNIYIAIKFRQPSYVTRQNISVVFDQKFIGKNYEGTDFLFLRPDSEDKQLFYDGVRTYKKPCKPIVTRNRIHKSLCGFKDTQVKGVNNGLGVYRLKKYIAVYEFMKPLKSSDAEHDIQVNHGDVFGVRVDLRLLYSRSSDGKEDSDKNIYIPGPKAWDVLKVKIPEINNDVF